jgi:trimeric autotransporter adhesin
MESPALPAGTSFALSGGIGYYQNRSAATTAFTARVGKNASVSAGVGFGLNTGEVGARGGFQVAW